MKTRVVCGENSVQFSLELNSIDDAARAIDAVKLAARLVWPDVVFDDEPGFPGKRRPKSNRRSAIPRELKAGSFDEKVLGLLGQNESNKSIADAVGVKIQVVALAKSRLRRGGHLNGVGHAAHS